MNLIELRVMFEEDLSKKYHKEPKNLLRSKTGSYLSKDVLRMWAGYKMFYESRFRLGESEVRIMGRYILGTLQDDGSVLMSRKPYRHASKIGAITEANRLVAEFGKTVCMFRCHEAFSPVHQEVIENVG